MQLTAFCQVDGGVTTDNIEDGEWNSGRGDVDSDVRLASFVAPIDATTTGDSCWRTGVVLAPRDRANIAAPRTIDLEIV